MSDWSSDVCSSDLFALDAQPLTGPNRVRIGEPIFGGTVSQVIQSRHADFKSGEFVEGRTGWREYAAIDPQRVPLRKIDPRIAPLSTALGVLGMPGQTDRKSTRLNSSH